MNTRISAGPWVLGRTVRPTTLAIFHETPTCRELVAAFQDHTVSYADARLMTASRKMLDFVRRVAEFSSMDEPSVLDGFLHDARALLAEIEGETV